MHSCTKLVIDILMRNIDIVTSDDNVGDVISTRYVRSSLENVMS